MSLESVNRICPNCMNPNYMVLLGDYSKTYKYKCINCNRYFNDIDFEKEPLQPVWLTECMNTKVDMVEVVRCKNCKHQNEYNAGSCPFYTTWGSVAPDDWFCADGDRGWIRNDDYRRDDSRR